MKNSFIKLSVIILCFSFSGCTAYLYEKATGEFNNLQYSNAIRDYKKVLAKKDYRDARIKLANSYLLVNDMEAAEPLFAQIVEYPEIEPINMLHYARVLMSNKKYDTAKIWLKNYLKVLPGDQVGMMLLESCYSVSSFMRDTTLFTLTEIKHPGFESAFGQVPYKDGVIFAADKKAVSNSRKDPWTGKSFYDLYYSSKDANGNWIYPEPITGEINGRYHEGPAVFNKTGDVAYFTRSNYFKNKLLKSSKDENNLKLFTAKLVNDEWTKLEQLPFNSDEYSVGHPALSPEEETLYFISDMPGGFGGTDIYKSVYNGKEWGKPENLGKEINTAGDEMFPFVSDDGKLYFSSNAHTNMGGLDIFSSSYDNINNKWGPIETLAYPLNSEHDDFAFVLHSDKKGGFVSSDRNSPDKIYEFKINDPALNLIGKVISKASKVPLENAVIRLRDQVNNITITVQTDNAGKYKMRLDPETEFAIEASLANYEAQKGEPISTKNKKYSEEFVRNFELDSLVFNLIGTVIEKENREPIENAIIRLTNHTDANKATVLTDKNGMYKMKLNPGTDFLVSASKENFLTQSADVSTKYKTKSEDFIRNFELDSLVLEKPIVVENIYYDFDKWFIRPDAALELDKLVRTLNDNPAIAIEMGSHADSRGSDDYNLRLTDKRAKSAVDYLVSQGIDKQRLTWKGYGESKLVNKCRNNVFCSEEDHQQNRRTEFKVTKIDRQYILNYDKEREGVDATSK